MSACGSPGTLQLILATSHYLDLDGAALTGYGGPPLKLHYLEAGHGKPLLLLHGTALDSAELTYGALLPELAAERRVIALDWPGYGKSDKPAAAYTMRFYQDVLATFVNRLGLDQFGVAAFSMGGGVALGFVLEHPEHVQNLILIDSYALGGGVHIPFLPFLLLRLPGVAPLVWHLLAENETFLAFCLRHFICGQGRSVDARMIADVQRQLELPGLYRAFTDWLGRELGAFRLTTDHRRLLKRVSTKTLLIHGGRDLVIPAWRARRAAKLMPNVEAHILPKIGHWAPREAPNEVLRVMLKFLED